MLLLMTMLAFFARKPPPMHRRILMARGDMGELDVPPCKSPLHGVTDEAWTEFVHALRTQSLGGVSESNGLGEYELKPRRLEDLGVMAALTCTRAPNGRQVWEGEFVPPLTADRFLSDPAEQYKALSRSLVDYDRRMDAGEILRPAGVGRSGALAILHRAGPGGLRTWSNPAKRFPETQALYDGAEGIF